MQVTAPDVQFPVYSPLARSYSMRTALSPTSKPRSSARISNLLVSMTAFSNHFGSVLRKWYVTGPPP